MNKHIRIVFTKKLFYALLSLLIVISLTFGLMKVIPGDPFQQEQALPAEIYQALCEHYGLNDPWHYQYTGYIKQISTFNLGPSLVYKESHVIDIIKTSFPTSALLGLEALLIAIPTGLLLGIWAAVREYGYQDRMIQIITMVGISIPSFILATLLQYILGMKMHLLPIACWGSFNQTILPALSLAALPAAFITHMTRRKMIEEFKQPYITTARAKGMSESCIIFKHALRNILIPLISYLGPLTGNILTGSFIIEKIFSVPGLGYWFVTSVLNRDYPLIMGITIFYCALLLLISLIVDIITLCLDPRLRGSES